MSNPDIVKYSFKKGQCGNPNGRPKGACLTTHLKKIMDKEFFVPEDLQKELQESNIKLTVSEIIALRLTVDAMKGKPYAIDTIFDRLYGKITQSMEQAVNVVTMPVVTINGEELKYNLGGGIDQGI